MWQAESVYSEVLYSLIHNISYVDALSDAGVQEIFDFVQNAFQFSDEQHQSILDAVKQQSVSSGTNQINFWQYFDLCCIHSRQMSPWNWK